MGALNSLRPAGSAILRNPILPVVVGVWALIQLPLYGYQPRKPLLAAFLGLGFTLLMILVVPFFQGGILGMANEALQNRTGISTLLDAGKSNYVSLLLGYFGILAINLVFGILVVTGFVVGGFGAIVGEGHLDPALLAVVAVFGIIVGLGYLLTMWVLQFYGHAIVLDDVGTIDGFRRSVGLVRRNLLSVAGYTVIVLIGSVVFGVAGGGVSLVLSPNPTPGIAAHSFSLPVLVFGGILFVVLSALLGSFYATYSVAFYRDMNV